MNIFIFGSSCSGKSTLAKMLGSKLDSYVYLDRDILVQEEGIAEEKADAELDLRVSNLGKYVIVDAQIPWRDKKQNEVYILVLPPLETVLERDAQRTILLKRPEQKAFWARSFVEQTHQQLSQQNKMVFDLHFDSSKVAVDDEAQAVMDFLQVRV